VAREWQVQEAKKNSTDLAQFFLESPLRDSELELTRDRRPAGRDSSLELSVHHLPARPG
jgi:hypothetical protein